MRDTGLNAGDLGRQEYQHDCRGHNLECAQHGVERVQVLEADLLLPL